MNLVNFWTRLAFSANTCSWDFEVVIFPSFLRWGSRRKFYGSSLTPTLTSCEKVSVKRWKRNYLSRDPKLFAWKLWFHFWTSDLTLQPMFQQGIQLKIILSVFLIWQAKKLQYPLLDRKLNNILRNPVLQFFDMETHFRRMFPAENRNFSKCLHIKIHFVQKCCDSEHWVVGWLDGIVFIVVRSSFLSHGARS